MKQLQLLMLLQTNQTVKIGWINVRIISILDIKDFFNYIQPALKSNKKSVHLCTISIKYTIGT